ncbi:MAG: hypothetical protein QXK37_03830 [Candidatus Woesearchaeota archaeon]
MFFHRKIKYKEMNCTCNRLEEVIATAPHKSGFIAHAEQSGLYYYERGNTPMPITEQSKYMCARAEDYLRIALSDKNYHIPIEYKIPKEGDLAKHLPFIEIQRLPSHVIGTTLGHRVYGRMFSGTKYIQISDDIADKLFEETDVHETLHFCNPLEYEGNIYRRAKDITCN